MTSFAHLPGGDLIDQGLADGAAGRITAAACLVAVGRTRLARAGLDLNCRGIQRFSDPEHQLYQLLCQENGDPYSKYNSLIRKLISFEQSLERQNARRHMDSSMNVIAESMQRTDSAAAEIELVSVSRRSRWPRRLLFLAVFCGLLFAFRHPLMTLAARLWIVNDPLEKADAAIVLGGNWRERPRFAGELYLRGMVPLVLVAETQLGAWAPGTEISEGILRKLGVPGSAIQRFGDGVTSTRDEAAGIRRWLESHPAQRLVIATDPFHTRRVSFAFRRELKGLPVELVVTSAPTELYDPLKWWESEEATKSFRSEVIKLVYYWVRG